MAVTGMLGGIYVSDTNVPLIPFEDEPCDVVGGVYDCFRIRDSTLRYWALETAVSVAIEVDGVEIGQLEDVIGSEYFEDFLKDVPRPIIEKPGGYVRFEKPLDDFLDDWILDLELTVEYEEIEVFVTGDALTIVPAGGFFNWGIDAASDNEDATTFDSGGWREFVPVLKGWSGNAEAFWGNDLFFQSLGKPVMIRLFIEKGEDKSCFEGFALMNSDGVDVPVDGLVQESIDFTGTGPLYFRK